MVCLCPWLQGTYLLLEKLRYAAYRRLLRKVHAVHAELEPEKRTQIPLLQFQTALAMQVGLAAYALTCSSAKGQASVVCYGHCAIGLLKLCKLASDGASASLAGPGVITAGSGAGYG